MPDTAAKLERVRAYLQLHNLDGALFRTRANFAWLTGGGDAHVVSQDEGAAGALVITADQALLLADSIEAPRLAAEEPIAGFTVKRRPWTEALGDALAKLVADQRFATDDPVATGLAPLPGDFLELRAPLDDAAIRQYRELGRDCSRALETVAHQMTPGDSGLELEAELARELLARGIQPHVVLVGFDKRLERYRHPTPTADRLERHAMLVVLLNTSKKALPRSGPCTTRAGPPAMLRATTFIVDGTAREVVTAASSAWPTVEVLAPNGAKLQRPGILVR